MKQVRLAYVICVLILVGCISIFLRVKADWNTQKVQIINSLEFFKRQNDSLNYRIRFFESIPLFERHEVHIENLKKASKIGDKVQFDVYHVVFNSGINEYLPQARILLSANLNSNTPYYDTIPVSSIGMHITYSPQSESDTVLKGIYQVPTLSDTFSYSFYCPLLLKK